MIRLNSRVPSSLKVSCTRALDMSVAWNFGVFQLERSEILNRRDSELITTHVNLATRKAALGEFC